jgi:5-methyltetrahydrofolate--homocysteine methyltransferase
MTDPSGPGRDILALIAERPRLMEGAMGTVLAARGLACENTGERNLTHPEVVAEIHRAYRDAGSQIFQSNSFAANRRMLERAGLGEQAAGIQQAAMRIVREAVGPGYPCGANVGPTGGLLEPYGEMAAEEAIAVFREQIESQLAVGADFLVFETFEDVNELLLGLKAADLADPDHRLPRLASVSFSSPNGRTMMGTGGAEAAAMLMAGGADVIGTNCGHLEGLRIGVREMLAVADRPVMVEPNAGVPVLVGTETRFEGTPEQSAEFARELIGLGARLVGGCCGNTPDHIRAMAEVVNVLPGA